MRQSTFKKTGGFHFSKTLSLLLLVTLSLLVFLLARSDLLKVRAVEVNLDKVDCASAGQIRETSKLLGSNFILIDSKKIEQQIKSKFLCIASVTTKRQLPEKVLLSASGRRPYLVLVEIQTGASSSAQLDFHSQIATPSAQANSLAQIVDQEGIIFSKTADLQPVNNIPKVYYQIEPQKETLLAVVEVFERLKTFGIRFNNSSIYPEKTLYISNNPRLIFDLRKDIARQLASLQLVLSKAKIEKKDMEFVDLRFDNPVVKFAPQKK